MTNNVYIQIGSSTADDQVVITVLDASRFSTFTVGSTAGVMDVYVFGDDVNELATPVSLVDLTSLTPATYVDETAAGKCFGFKGIWRRVVVRQKGATAVSNAFLNCY